MKEVRELWRGADRRSLFLVLASCVLLTIAWYQGRPSTFHALFDTGGPTTPAREWLGFLWFHAWVAACGAIIPVAIIVFGFRERLDRWGVCLGDWRFGWKFLVAWAVVMVPSTWMSAHQPAFQAEYPLAKAAGAGWGAFLLWELTYLLYYAGWELMFRGWLQMGLTPRIGFLPALAVQTIASTIIHFGKPQSETFAAIAGGVVFGTLVVRTRSLLWPLACHWLLGASADWFCLLLSGRWRG